VNPQISNFRRPRRILELERRFQPNAGRGHLRIGESLIVNLIRRQAHRTADMQPGCKTIIDAGLNVLKLHIPVRMLLNAKL